VPDASGNLYEDFCDDPSISKDDIKKLSDATHHSCESKQERIDKFGRPSGSGGCKRDPALGRRACRTRRAAQKVGEPRFDKLRARFQGQLVKSFDVRQSARELCKSKGSVGPNFYSHHEESFCDMSTKKLYPRCKEDDATECFDM
jgi:hypothetical protein